MKRFSLSTCYLFLSVLLFGQWQDTGTDLMHYVESKRSLALGQNGQQLAVSEQGVISVYYWDNQVEDWRQKGSQIIDSSAWDVIAMSEDGLTLANKCSYTDSSGREIGYVKIYAWNGSDWQQKGQDLTENSHFYNSGSFGSSLAFSANGESIVISASVQYELIDNVGMLYNYRWENNSWQLKGVPIEGQHYNGRYGRDMGLSADGEYWAILGGFHSPASASKYLDYLHWDGQNWQHQSTVMTYYSLVGEMSIAFSGAGEHFVMAQAQGTTPNPYGPPPAPSPGRFRAYEFDGSQFNLKGQEIRSTDSQAFFGESVTISADGTVIVVAAPSGNNAGYIRSYAWCNNQWETPFAQIEGNNRSNGKFGKALALSADGRRVVFNDYACHCLKTYDMQSSNNCFAVTSTSPVSHSSSNIRQGIYPNPNKGYFNIVLNKEASAIIRIYNIAGQLLYEKASPQSSLHEIDFQADAGIYFVEIEQNGEKERLKLIHNGK